MMPRLLVVAAALALASPAVLAADPPKKILLVGSPADDHPPGTHEYAAGMEIVAKLLKPVREAEVTVARAEGPWKDGPELIGRADCAVIFLTEGAKWVSADPKRLAAFREVARRGGGLVCLHWGMGTREAEPVAAFVELFGGCHGGPDRKYAVVETTVAVAEPKHPVAAGIKDFAIKDEFYYRLKFPKPDAAVKSVLQVTIDGNKETVAWAWERPDGGRSFGFTGLHFHDNWRRAEYRRVVAQGVLWAAKLPVPANGLPVDLADSDYQLPLRK
jgi:type 1 glutamine amidotransferase